MPQKNWPSLQPSKPLREKEKCKSIHQYPIATQARTSGAGSLRMKAAALETVQTLSATARHILFAHVTTGSAVASLAIIAVPHLEILLRGVFHVRG